MRPRGAVTTASRLERLAAVPGGAVWAVRAMGLERWTAVRVERPPSGVRIFYQTGGKECALWGGTVNVGRHPDNPAAPDWLFGVRDLANQYLGKLMRERPRPQVSRDEHLLKMIKQDRYGAGGVAEHVRLMEAAVAKYMVSPPMLQVPDAGTPMSNIKWYTTTGVVTGRMVSGLPSLKGVKKD